MKKLLTGSNEKIFINKKSGKDKRLNDIREGLISKADEKDFNEFKKLMKSKYEKAHKDYTIFNKEQIELNFYIFYLWNKCNNLERDLKRDKLERISLDFMDISSNLIDYISKFGEIKNTSVKNYISDFSNVTNNKTQRISKNKFDIIFSIVKSLLKQREYYLSKAIFIQNSLSKFIKAELELIETLTESERKRRFENCVEMVKQNENMYPILFCYFDFIKKELMNKFKTKKIHTTNEEVYRYISGLTLSIKWTAVKTYYNQKYLYLIGVKK